MKKFIALMLISALSLSFMAFDMLGNPVENITGEYVFFYYGRFDGEDYTSADPLCKVTITDIGDGDGRVMVGPFGFDGAVFEAVYDSSLQTLTFPLKQDISCNNTRMTIYTYDFNSLRAKAFTMDVDRERHLLHFGMDGGDEIDQSVCMVLGHSKASAGTKIYAQMFRGSFFGANAVMSFKTFDEGSQQLSNPKIAQIHAEPLPHGLRIINFLGLNLFSTVEFTLDHTNKTATSGEQPITTGSFLWSIDDNGKPIDKTPVMTADGSPEVLSCDAIGVYDNTTSTGRNYYQVRIELPFDPFTAGINDIAAPSTSPLEYYNLQGIRIPRPTHGLCLRRQANQTTKIIIR